MKRLIAILLMLPLLLNAQNESKYMEGAVPEVNGKVVFTRHLNVSGFNQQQIFNAVTDWISRTFTSGDARILISDPENGTIVAQNQNEIIAHIGIFPGKVKMASIIKVICNDGNCVMETSRIRYTNNPASEKPTDIITAEEYITDKYAMNKARTKVHKGIGDYRIGTIDIIDKNALDAQSAVYTYNNAEFANYAQTMANIPAPTNSAVAQPAKATNTAQDTTEQPSAEVNREANTQIKESTTASDIKIADEVSEGLKNGEYIAYLIAVENRKLPNPVAGKGVLDLNAQNPAISFTLESDRDNILFILEMASNFTIAICEANDTSVQNPALILDCSKAQQFDKLFIGSIKGLGKK